MKYTGKQQGHPFPEAHPFGEWKGATGSPLGKKKNGKKSNRRS